MSQTSNIPLLSSYQHCRGKAGWQSPSNIALVKYWGKKPIQIPANASISFTLAEAISSTTVEYQPRHSEWVSFTFEGRSETSFADRIIKYLRSISSQMPWLEHLSFKIESENTFPHSSGIASSASSMSALALCLCDIEKEIHRLDITDERFLQRASHFARLGSGSAARSVYPFLAAWGVSEHIADSHDEYAIPVATVDPIFKTFHDDIVIISPDKKSVSSSAGHALMDNNIFAKSRYEQADLHMQLLLETMQSGNLMAFGKIVEDEALSLHALMMCSDPSYILMKPGTLQVINLVRAFRKDTGYPLFFTLDAGPNVHLLYPDSIHSEVSTFVEKSLKPIAHKGRIIKDHVGNGPSKIF